MDHISSATVALSFSGIISSIVGSGVLSVLRLMGTTPDVALLEDCLLTVIAWIPVATSLERFMCDLPVAC